MIPDRRAIRLVQAGDLRRRIRYRTFSCLQLAGPRAVAVALARHRAVFVIVTAKRTPRLTLQRLLHDQPGGKLNQCRAPGGRRQPPFDQG